MLIDVYIMYILEYTEIGAVIMGVTNYRTVPIGAIGPTGAIGALETCTGALPALYQCIIGAIQEPYRRYRHYTRALPALYQSPTGKQLIENKCHCHILYIFIADREFCR